LLLLILILNTRRAGLETLAGSVDAEIFTANKENKESKENNESAEDYQSLFAILDKELRAQNWYCLPRLTLSQLSDLSGMSTRDISRCINLVAGVSFNDYVNQLRIERIKHALQTENNSNLTDLAFAVGFNSK